MAPSMSLKIVFINGLVVTLSALPSDLQVCFFMLGKVTLHEEVFSACITDELFDSFMLYGMNVSVTGKGEFLVAVGMHIFKFFVSIGMVLQ